MQINKVYVGNNLDVLKTFPDNSIDSIVTDPPYGLGKEPNANELLKDWLEHGYHEIKGKGFMGKEWDAFVPQPILWKECLRVLKSGGHLLSFAGTRTYDWVVMGLRLAGFEIRDQLAWIYGNGFPKSHDISKAIDKMMGAEREVVGINPNAIGRKDNMGQFQPKVDREITDKKRIFNITAPSTEEAKQWEGWGTALKPALEPIVMARKPLDGTVAQNVLKYGVGGINIDGCRVELANGEETWSHGDLGKFENVANGYQRKNKSMFVNKGEASGNTLGRFPANVIHDGSEEVVKLFPNTEAGGSITKTYKDNSPLYGDYNVKAPFESYGDSGSVARFFYTAKASQTERNWGLSGFEEKYTASAEFRPNHMEKALEGDNGNPYGRWQPKKNIHPTVKPLDLMRYLVRLITPKDGICLDPYLGSGTTAIACKSEKINYIGIELIQEYADIAEARIKAETVQYDIFDFLDESQE
ncbi:MAG: DNA methyltransferase [Sulfolobaceae archaeon]